MPTASAPHCATESQDVVRKPREVLLYIVALQFPVLDVPQGVTVEE